MLLHSAINSAVFKSLVRKGAIALGGNKKLKIYGTLRCASGKSMKVQNWVFFSSEQEAVKEGYRPCGHCMRAAYLQWKELNKQHT